MKDFVYFFLGLQSMFKTDTLSQIMVADTEKEGGKNH
jgi:hypothetical protein